LGLCACSMPATKQDIRKSAIRQDSFVVKKNYQALLKCWDDNAEKVTIDFHNTTSSQIYPDIGVAEMYSSLGGKNYFILFELKKIAPNQTRVSGYGQGQIGKTFIPLWSQTLRDCAAK
jgi:hypothetical protein